jgi:DNA primase
MNCNQANKLPIKEIVESFGLKDGVCKGCEIWYCSPFRTEDKPSFKINTKTNRWYDFGKSSKSGGTVVDFIVELKQCSINEALKFIDGAENVLVKTIGKSHLFPPEQGAKKNDRVEGLTKSIVSDKKLEIVKVKQLNNPALLQYLNSRKVDIGIAKEYMQEIYIKNAQTNKIYFAICFKNDSGGYEWRNKYMRGVMGNKDITYIQNSFNSSKIALFEGFIDFVSYLTYLVGNQSPTDYLVLNSVTMVNRAVNIIKAKKYTNVDLFLDNDEAGDIAVTQLQEQLEVNVKDHRAEFLIFKDFNDFLVEKHKNTKT